jgi:primosomal protein N'
MLDVMEGGFLASYRRICRWYSQKFVTPLHEVEELPTEYILQHFFEYQFEDMGKAERKKLALEMTQTEAEAKAKAKDEEDKSDDAFLKKTAKDARKMEKKRLADLAKQAEATAKMLAAIADKEFLPIPPEKPRGNPKPKANPAPPDFGLSFDESGNLVGDEESIPVPPPRKR